MSIDIRDVNDHSPVFTPSEIVHELSESSLPDTTSFVIPTAEDGDSVSLSIQKYVVQPDNVDEDSDLFHVKVNSFVVAAFNCSLEIQQGVYCLVPLTSLCRLMLPPID